MGTNPHREGQERGREGGIEWEGELELKKKGGLGRKRERKWWPWEREREELEDKSQRKQNMKKGIKYKLFGLQLCYNAIIHLGWHCSIIANFLQW